jgi:L-lactate dehydrogenase complex protein LldE
LSKPASVYYFGTCLIELLFPRAGLAGMQLLRRAGIEVIFPDEQSCCGQPAFNSGYRTEALGVARAQLGCFPKDIPVVIPSASCAGMIRNHWPELFAGEADEALATAVAGRTWELSEFLADVLQLQLEDLGEPIRITLHNSCSARRETGTADRAEALLGQLANVEVLPHAHAEECCGFGGTFAVKQPELSAAMARSKCEAIESSGAQRLVSQDCGCLMNLGGMLERRGREIEIQHIAEFLLERSS